MMKANFFWKNRWQWLLFLLALGLRLVRLGEIPISLHWDEASWGYNAYSILKTGRDEYGIAWPLIFKAFGDYKAPVLVYLTSFSIAVFGLNEFAIRLPAAFFGAMDVVLLIWFVRTFFQKKPWAEKVGLLAGTVLALSPWHYDYSHGAWEANILFAFYLLGLIFFLQAQNKSPKKLVLAAFFFGLCFYVYNSAKLILPLTLLGLIVTYWRSFWRLPKKTLLLSFLVGLVMILPVAWLTFKGGAGGRLKVMSAFSYPRPASELNKILTAEKKDATDWQVKIFHNPVEYFTEYILLRYLNHFSPKFLFFEGDWSDYRHGVPNFGVLNWLDVVLLTFGIIMVVHRRLRAGFIFYWLLIAPLPAALTRDIIQSLRAYFMVLPLSIISGLGFYQGLVWLKKWSKWLGRLALVGFGVGYMFVFLVFLDRYFVHAPFVNSQYWQYGYKQAVQYVASVKDQYRKIVFTSKYGQPYIYYLLYSQYSPSDYQSQAQLLGGEDGDVGYVAGLDQIEFRNLYWPRDRFEPGVLYVGATYEIPDQDIEEGQARVLKDIYFLNGELAFRIAETLEK